MSKEAKQKMLAVMTQECHLLDLEIKKDNLLESVNRVEEQIEETKKRIDKLNNKEGIDHE